MRSSSPRPRCSTGIGATLGQRRDVAAVTDVTGFGLLGHALEMARGAGVDAGDRRVDGAAPGAGGGAGPQGFVTGASGRNWASYGAEVSLPADMPDWRRQLL